MSNISSVLGAGYLPQSSYQAGRSRTSAVSFLDMAARAQSQVDGVETVQAPSLETVL